MNTDIVQLTAYPKNNELLENMPQKTLRMNTCRIGSQNWGPNLLKIGRISEKEDEGFSANWL